MVVWTYHYSNTNKTELLINSTTISYKTWNIKKISVSTMRDDDTMTYILYYIFQGKQKIVRKQRKFLVTFRFWSINIKNTIVKKICNTKSWVL